MRDQYDIGADPSVVLADLAEFAHFVTRVKIVPAVADDISLVEDERTRGRAFAAALSMRILNRIWQMLLKGIAEVQGAGKPIAAAEMVLVRIAYAADLPTPDEAIRMIDDGGSPARSQASGNASASANGGGTTASSSAMSSASAAPSAPRMESSRGGPRAALATNPVARAPDAAPLPQALVIGSFEALIALAADKRDIQIKMALERDVRLVRCEDGKLEIALENSAAKTLLNDLSRKLQLWTGRPWMVSISKEQGAPTMKSLAEARQAELETGGAGQRGGQGGAGAVSGRRDRPRAWPEGFGARFAAGGAR